MTAPSPELDAFILRAGFTHGWDNLETSARRMAERAVLELAQPPIFKPPQCLITGCALHNLSTGAWAWGDLHTFGPFYIFNSTVDLAGNERWMTTPLPPDQKALRFRDGQPMFHRRGVFILPATPQGLTEAARAYIAGSIRP